MQIKNKIVSQVLLAANKAGFDNITPVVLHDSANLIIHLSPHKVVARVSTFISTKYPDQASILLARELRIAEHLHSRDVPVILPIDANAGPYDLGNIWITLWNYIKPVKLNLLPSEAIHLISKLSVAMRDFPDQLPALGVWERVRISAERLSKGCEYDIKPLLIMFNKIDHQIRSIEPKLLLPAHGDAHSGNLIASSKGWLWTDFEDVSLMPKYWDIASFVANQVLFNGFKHPVFDYLTNQTNTITDLTYFKLAITARILMSVLGSLDLALQGFGDIEFAIKQLKLVNSFFPLTL